MPSSVGVPVKTLGVWLVGPLSHPNWGFPIAVNTCKAGRSPLFGAPSGRNIMEFCWAKPVYTGQPLSAERIKKRLPSGASTENPLPRPCTTSTVRWVWLQ